MTRRSLLLSLALMAAVGLALRFHHVPSGAARPSATAAPAPPVHTENNDPQPTKRGAVVAAARFVCSGGELLAEDPIDGEARVRAMTATSVAEVEVERQLSAVRELRDALASGTGPIVYRQSALAWRVESYSDAEARVAIWSVGVLARDGIAPPQAGWHTSTVDLVWEDGGWKVLYERVVPGPAPLLDNSAPPATTEQLVSALDGFSDFDGVR